VRFIDYLEGIKVEVEDRNRLLAHGRSRQGSRESLQEIAAIGQGSEAVVQGLVTGLLLVSWCARKPGPDLRHFRTQSLELGPALLDGPDLRASGPLMQDSRFAVCSLSHLKVRLPSFVAAGGQTPS